MYIGVANRDCDVPGSRVLGAYIDEFYVYLIGVCLLFGVRHCCGGLCIVLLCVDMSMWIIGAAMCLWC